MVDERKVRLMTRLAIYEKNEGKRSIGMSKYYRNDYVRLNALKTWVSTTLVYWLIVGCYVFVKFDDMLAKVNDIDYFDVMYKLLGGYVAACLIYFLFASMLYNYRYYKAKDGLVEYNSNLKDLIELEGGPMHRGKAVSKSQARVFNDNNEAKRDKTSSASATAKKATVNKTELMKQRMAIEEQKKQQEILHNVEQRNARIAAKNEAVQRQQRQMEADRQRIKEKRAQYEKEQLERIRRERQQQMSRVNHTYNNSGKEQ